MPCLWVCPARPHTARSRDVGRPISEWCLTRSRAGARISLYPLRRSRQISATPQSCLSQAQMHSQPAQCRGPKRLSQTTCPPKQQRKSSARSWPHLLTSCPPKAASHRMKKKSTSSVFSHGPGSSCSANKFGAHTALWRVITLALRTQTSESLSKGMPLPQKA